MANLNRVELIGTLADEPRVSPGGSGAASIRVVVENYYTDKGGVERKSVDAFWVRLYGWLAEFAALNLGKGSPVLVVGKLRTESWEDQRTKEKKYSVVVVASDIQSLAPADRNDAPEEGRVGGDGTGEDLVPRHSEAGSEAQGATLAEQRQAEDQGGGRERTDVEEEVLDPGSAAFEKRFGLGKVPF